MQHSARIDERRAWYLSLPTVYSSVGALITNPGGLPLLVMPRYRDEWTVPGGVAEDGEPPHVACQREVAEETGLTVVTGALLAVTFIPARDPQLRPVLYFMFDCGTAEAHDIVLSRTELADFAFCHPYETAGQVNPYVSSCIIAALAARRTGATAYLPGRPASWRRSGDRWPA